MSIEELKAELRENYQRTEEVLTGMDAYISHLHNTIRSHEERISMLEGQLASLIEVMPGITPQEPHFGPGLR